jgi:hypothetical protein
LTHETTKWILFSFSLLWKAKQWYAHSVGGANGNWDKFHDKFCLAFFLLSKVYALRIEVLTLKHVTPNFTRKTGCISYMRYYQNYTHMIDNRV